MHMLTDVEFAPLVHRPQEIPRVARWWCGEWGLPERHSSFDDYVQELQSLPADTLPLHMIAERGGRALGVATLKVKVDHPVVRGSSHWLSGVYVESAYRHHGIAAALCREIVNAARRRAIEALYLQTEHLDGGLYAKLGWTLAERCDEGGVPQVLMVRSLTVDPPERGGMPGR
jgi:GNAT superfamily N-acetyltransferase